MQNIPSTTRVGLKYGFYTIIAYLLVNIVLSQAVPVGGIAFMLNLVVFSASISYGMLEFRRGNDDTMTYLQGLNLGLIVSALSGLFLGLLGAITLSVMSSKDLQTMKDLYLKNLEAQGYAAQQLKEMKPMLEIMYSPTGAFVGSLFSWLFLGVLITLLMGLFMRQKN